MKFKLLLSLIFITSFFMGNAQDTEEKLSTEELKAYQVMIDSINNTFTYKHGTVTLKNNIAKINVPEGFKYLDSEQSNRVLTELWGNPPEETLGMLFNENETPVSENMTFAIEIQYSDEGYISDKDAKKIDYDELLEGMQKDIKKINPERIKQGYPSIELVNWASPPYYDASTKKLYWAKEMKFNDEEENTLNYNIRILGRKGYLMLNAIGTMNVLSKFEAKKEAVLASVNFTEGNKYSDFNASTDKIAAYGIGGLIAGKVLAKVGFFAVILKFGKIILIGILAFFGAIKNKIFGSKKKKEEVVKINKNNQDV